jgi:hypothetical protein
LDIRWRPKIRTSQQFFIRDGLGGDILVEKEDEESEGAGIFHVDLMSRPPGPIRPGLFQFEIIKSIAETGMKARLRERRSKERLVERAQDSPFGLWFSVMPSLGTVGTVPKHVIYASPRCGGYYLPEWPHSLRTLTLNIRT